MTSPNRPGGPNRPGAPNRPGVARPGAPNRDAPNYSTVTSSGIEPNVAAALSYILGLITGIVFLIVERQNRHVRFHAAQSVIASALIVVVSIGVSMISPILALIPIIGWVVVFILTMTLTVGTFVLWLLCMWKAYTGDKWELPVAGEMAKKMV